MRKESDLRSAGNLSRSDSSSIFRQMLPVGFPSHISEDDISVRAFPCANASGQTSGKCDFSCETIFLRIDFGIMLAPQISENIKKSKVLDQ